MTNTTLPHAHPNGLHPELQACHRLCDGIQWIQHPLVTEPYYDPSQNERLNRALRSKRSLLRDALRERNWIRAMCLYERSWRLDRFERLATSQPHSALMTDARYWRTLRYVLIDQEDCYRQRATFRRLLLKNRRSKALRPLLMTTSERRALAAMPETLTVYRGCQDFNRKGWSWTLSLDKAIWFSRRNYRGRPMVLTGAVSKRDVIAFLTSRGEDEILVPPEKVHLITKTAQLAGSHPRRQR